MGEAQAAWCEEQGETAKEGKAGAGAGWVGLDSGWIIRRAAADVRVWHTRTASTQNQQAQHPLRNVNQPCQSSTRQGSTSTEPSTHQHPPHHQHTPPPSTHQATKAAPTCCAMVKLPLMRAWLAMMAAQVATATTGHCSEFGTDCQ